jgi:hypothetical protein
VPGSLPTPDSTGPLDPTQRRLAERLLVAAVRRLQRRMPLRDGFRTDAVLAEVRRAAAGVRPPGHRGRQRLELDDTALRSVIDDLVAADRLARGGPRLRLAEEEEGLDPVMVQRIAQLLGGLEAAGLEPPPVEPVALRLGIPPGVIAELRASGRLVHLAPGIDYPAETWRAIEARLDRLQSVGPLTVARVRPELRATRRHAEAILARRTGQRMERRGPRRRRDRRAV